MSEYLNFHILKRMRYTNFHIISKISRGTRVLIRESLKTQFLKNNQDVLVHFHC